MRLQVITREEYVLSTEEFSRELREKFKKPNFNSDNRVNFLWDFGTGELNRYRGTYVVYKEGILCGQSKDKELLYRDAVFNLCSPDIDLYPVPKNGENPDFK